MRPFKRAVLIASVLAVVPVLAGSHVALADVVPPAMGYEIEAKTGYCQHGGTGCSGTFQTLGPQINDLKFVEVDLYRFTPGNARGEGQGDDRDNNNEASGNGANEEGKAGGGDQSANALGNASGTPELVHLVCANHSFDKTGPHTMVADFTVVSSNQFANYLPPPGGGPPGAPPPGPNHVGRIFGNASVRDALETSPDAKARVDVVAYDPRTGAWATVTGRDVTNNPPDTLVSGGFDVRIVGPTIDILNHGASTGWQDMRCHTHGITPVTPPTGEPPVFENVSPDTDGDANS